ncbi:hypothetical protein RC55_23540 [Herbaspirillum seropedicae]|nr:hypothetical protein ACP92_07775 [Herbaspirillum seropedicae]NQE32178.1 hypothetical protein [Herbaspirillum seropedicae]
MNFSNYLIRVVLGGENSYFKIFKGYSLADFFHPYCYGSFFNYGRPKSRALDLAKGHQNGISFRLIVFLTHMELQRIVSQFV